MNEREKRKTVSLNNRVSSLELRMKQLVEALKKESGRLEELDETVSVEMAKKPR